MGQRAVTSRPEYDQIIGRYLNRLPRTITRSGEPLLLDDTWRFELDLHGRGLDEHWEQGHVYAATTKWPGSIESQLEAGLSLPWEDEVIACTSAISCCLLNGPASLCRSPSEPSGMRPASG